MSIQAGWNQALISAGALGKLKEQTDLQEYSQLKSMYGTIKEKMDPAMQKGIELSKAAGQSGADIRQAMALFGDPETSLVDTSDLPQELQDQAAEFRKSRDAGVQDIKETLMPQDMPRKMQKAYKKAAAEWTFSDAYGSGGGGFKAYQEGLAERKAMQAQMAAQRAQDAAQAADLQPRNSMAPIIEQLRRNTQNAVKGGTK